MAEDTSTALSDNINMDIDSSPPPNNIPVDDELSHAQQDFNNNFSQHDPHSPVADYFDPPDFDPHIGTPPPEPIPPEDRARNVKVYHDVINGTFR